MKKLLILLVPALILTSKVAFAEENDRYRAVILQQGGGSENRAKVFIIDSEDGHMWTWEDKTKFTTKNGQIGFGTQLIYQGKVRPGSASGEIVEQVMNK
ncbi:MAG: hypothetical protein V3V31_02660 [Methylococcales bacterium]